MDSTTTLELRLWTTDAEGRSVLRGLTAEETEWYQEFTEKELAQRMGLSKPWATPADFEADRTRWRELNRTHEHARAQTIFVDEQKRIDEEEAQTRGKRTKRRY